MLSDDYYNNCRVKNDVNHMKDHLSNKDVSFNQEFALKLISIFHTLDFKKRIK